MIKPDPKEKNGSKNITGKFEIGTTTRVHRLTTQADINIP